MQALKQIINDILKVEANLKEDIGEDEKFQLLNDYISLFTLVGSLYGKETYEYLRPRLSKSLTAHLNAYQLLKFDNYKSAINEIINTTDINLNINISILKYYLMQKGQVDKLNIEDDLGQTDESLEIVRDFVETEPLLKKAFIKATNEQRLVFYQKKHRDNTVVGHHVHFNHGSLNPLIAVKKSSKAIEAATIVHELGHNCEYLFGQFNSIKTFAKMEILPEIYEHKFVGYAKDNLQKDDYKTILTISNLPISYLFNIYLYNISPKIYSAIYPGRLLDHPIDIDYKYALAYLVAINENINSDDIEKYLKVDSSKINDYLEPFNLREETLYDGKVLSKQLKKYK